MSGTTERIDLGRRPLLGESDPLNLSHSSLYRPRRGIPRRAPPPAARVGDGARAERARGSGQLPAWRAWQRKRGGGVHASSFSSVLMRSAPAAIVKPTELSKDSQAERPRRHDVSDRTTGVRGPGGAPVQIMRYACLAQDALLAGAVELNEGILRLLGRFLLRT